MVGTSTSRNQAGVLYSTRHDQQKLVARSACREDCRRVGGRRLLAGSRARLFRLLVLYRLARLNASSQTKLQTNCNTMVRFLLAQTDRLLSMRSQPSIPSRFSLYQVASLSAGHGSERISESRSLNPECPTSVPRAVLGLQVRAPTD